MAEEELLITLASVSLKSVEPSRESTTTIRRSFGFTSNHWARKKVPLEQTFRYLHEIKLQIIDHFEFRVSYTDPDPYWIRTHGVTGLGSGF